MDAPQFIEPRLYRKICSRIPILCVDLIIEDYLGKYLLVRRKNHPLRGKWWVPGGRVHLFEDPMDAALRKCHEEVGRELVSIKFVGYMSDKFDRNVFERREYHTISIVFRGAIDGGPITLDSQSSDYKWADRLPNRFSGKLMYCGEWRQQK